MDIKKKSLNDETNRSRNGLPPVAAAAVVRAPPPPPPLPIRNCWDSPSPEVSLSRSVCSPSLMPVIKKKKKKKGKQNKEQTSEEYTHTYVQFKNIDILIHINIYIYLYIYIYIYSYVYVSCTVWMCWGDSRFSCSEGFCEVCKSVCVKEQCMLACTHQVQHLYKKEIYTCIYICIYMCVYIYVCIYVCIYK